MGNNTRVDKLASEKAIYGCCSWPRNGAKPAQVDWLRRERAAVGLSTIFTLLIQQHEKALLDLVVRNLLLLCQRAGDRKARSVLPPPPAQMQQHTLLVIARLSCSEENARVMKVKTTSLPFCFFIIWVVWSFYNHLSGWSERESLKKMWKTTSKNVGALCTLGFCFDLSPA